MGETTTISWCDKTFNCWVGCTKVSPACDSCYAESWAKRTGHPELWTGERRRTTLANWNQPVKWNATAKRLGVRHRVFCASLADVFDNQVPEQWRHDLWDLIGHCPNLDWLLLTKRPQNIAKMLPTDWDTGYQNVWLGTTAENQIEANRRVPHLLAVPAAVRFLSCEPLLGPIDLTEIEHAPDHCIHALWGVKAETDGTASFGPKLDWIIVGGESGPKARPMNMDWVRSLHRQCSAAGTAFHFKQVGGLRPTSNGCEIDGREYKEFPAALAA